MTRIRRSPFRLIAPAVLLAVDLLLQPGVAHPAGLVLMSPLLDTTFELARRQERS